jgi:nitrate/TMAO reductase-like tetraheme cytochrome c subunit
MPTDSSVGASRSETPRNTHRRSILWILSWALGFVIVGVGLVALTNHAVNWSSSDKYCGTACHSMTWVTAAYYQSPHYTNPVGVRATCGECHIPYDAGHATATEYVKLLLFKADRGAKDEWYELNKSIATKEEWEKRRPALSSGFEGYLTKHNYITCRGCHSLSSFGGPRSHMKLVVHQGMVSTDSYNCLDCHANIGHVYEQPASKLTGWYTVEQADAGKKLFIASCSNCHGEKLEGGTGPALKGVTGAQRGAKLLTVWGEIKGPMAEYAGRALTTQQSLDILSYLLQQNGLAAGNHALANTRELSDTFPEK